MNSVLSPGVRVDVGAVVRDSIVMFDSIIRSGAVVDRAILDKEVVIGQGAIVGDGPDFDTPNRQEPGRLNTGITVVGKRAVVPRGARIGRNVKVAAGVRSKKVIPNGASVEIGAASRREAREARNTAPPSAATPAAESTNGQHEAVQVRAGGGRSAAGSRTPQR